MYNAIRGFVEFVFKYYATPMVSNSAPLLVKGSKRIDSDKRFLDGKPIFGAHKTWEGFLSGITMGMLSSSMVGVVFQDPYLVLLNIGGSISALIGDLAGAFVKRRLGIKPGEPLPLVDQLDFALAATLLYMLADKSFASQPTMVLSSLILIAILHIATNNIAFMLGMKDKRW
ncbi:CDP-archaeol synthase [Thermogladius sp. 4427co]|uniref:CDP-archaeol synthase n=1 Tax=Thermogladius sp. 4427co TaxID=3450718 RepID=UPI003F79DE06